MRRLALVPGILLVVLGTPLSAGRQAAHDKDTVVSPETVKWGPAPPALPPGATVAVLAGDPAKEGTFIVRAKFPDGYKVPPHMHPTDEHVTVIQGTLMMGMGDKVDTAAMHTVPVGGFFTAPAKQAHYVAAKGETIVQIVAAGPFVVTYVNPADDPRKQTKSN